MDMNENQTHRRSQQPTPDRIFVKFPKNANLWFPAYLKDRARHLIPRSPAKRLWVSITDHYEPWGGGVTREVAEASLEAGYTKDLY